MLKSVAFIGGGIMGEAMIRGLLSRGLVDPACVAVHDPVTERRQVLSARYKVKAVATNREAIDGAEVVIVVVKPQNIPSVLRELSGEMRPEQLVLSIAAGVSVTTLSLGLQHGAVVRAMPNAPAQIGEGMTVWTATADVSEAQLDQARTILQALGREIHVSDEKYLDMATALSGSGPAWVFLFMEALVDAGVHLGFARAVAEELVYQTTLGSVLLARETGKHLAELRNNVTSPAGTTADGLYQLEDGQIRVVIDRAVRAAYERSRSLGQGK